MEFRGRYIERAKRLGYMVSAVYFDIPFDTCHARILARKDHKFSKTPKKLEGLVIALKTWFRDKQKPIESEGFERILVLTPSRQAGIYNGSEREITYARMDLSLHDMPLAYRITAGREHEK